jgi:hypothetical protein
MSKGKNISLWVVQGLVALVFMFAGVFKLMTPAAVLEEQAHMNAYFLKFIATCEVLGALGLILPGVLNIQRRLTPIAAVGLTIIMIGAISVSLLQGMAATAILPLIVGVLAIVIVLSRRPWMSETAV